MFVIGFSSVLAQEDLHNLVSERILIILGAVITMLKIIQSIEQAEAARKLAAEASKTEKGSPLTKKPSIPSNEDIMYQYLRDFQTKSPFTIVKNDDIDDYDDRFDDDRYSDADSDDNVGIYPEGDEVKLKSFKNLH